MRTIERFDNDVAVSTRTQSNVWVIATFTVFALLLGVVGGFMLRGGVDDAVLADGGDLSARQEQMVAMIDDYRQAWEDGDAERVVSFFTDNGVFVLGGVEYRIDDGSLAELIDRPMAGEIVFRDPMVVYGRWALNFHTYLGSVVHNTYTFTGAGDLLLMSHVAN